MKTIEQLREERKQVNNRIIFLENTMLGIRKTGSKETWSRSETLIYSEMLKDVELLSELAGDLSAEIYDKSGALKIVD